MLRTPYNLMQRIELAEQERDAKRKADQLRVGQLISCFGKSSFDDRHQADAVANRHRKSKTSLGFASYHCPHCGKYHLSKRAGGKGPIKSSKPRHYDSDY